METELLQSITYEDGPISIEAIMEQIRDYLAKKQGVTRTHPAAQVLASRNLDHTTYDELIQANHTYDKTYVAPYITAANIPVLGKLWLRIRSKAHTLVVFYVNRAVEAQTRFNASVVRVLNGIVSGIDTDQTPERIDQLERRITELERQLKTLSGPKSSVGSQGDG